MKTLILTFAALMIMPLSAMSHTPDSRAYSLEVSEAPMPIFGLGKPKYNKNKIDRKNSVGKKNRRTKKINRKFGIGSMAINLDHAA